MNFQKVLIVLSVALLTACATTAPPPEERHPRDPWEPYNRNMYAFNRSVDKAVFRPVARGYKAITPDPVETGISNVFENLMGVPNMLNLLLQGRPTDTVKMGMRFVMNTVFGLGGIFDVATRSGVPQFDEDFGQTLGVWGWEDSRYFMLPFLGPSTVRDSAARIPDRYPNLPWRRLTDARWYIVGLDIIQLRASLLPREEQLESAFDEYLFVRDAWLQNRDFKIHGETATPDYEAFLEDE